MARPSIVAQINAYNTYTPQELVQAYGNIGRAAAAMAGKNYTKGIAKDKEYKAARRGLERQLKGQHKPSKANQAKLNEAGKAASGKKPIGITFAGQVKVNGYTREREVNRTYDADEWDDLSEMALEGDEDGIWEAIADEYGVRSFDMEDGEIEIGED